MDKILYWGSNSFSVKKFPEFYKILVFITVFQKVRQWSLRRAWWIWSSNSYPILGPILISSSPLWPGVPSWLFRFSPPRTLYVFLFYHACYIPRPSRPLWFKDLNGTWVQNVCSIRFHNALRSPGTLALPCWRLLEYKAQSLINTCLFRMYWNIDWLDGIVLPALSLAFTAILSASHAQQMGLAKRTANYFALDVGSVPCRSNGHQRHEIKFNKFEPD
jgi:hypothetical protein